MRNKLTPFGREIKKRLIDMGLRQQDLAERIGCHPNYILQIMDGSRSGQKYLEAICRELDMPYNAERGA